MKSTFQARLLCISLIYKHNQRSGGSEKESEIALTEQRTNNKEYNLFKFSEAQANRVPFLLHG